MSSKMDKYMWLIGLLDTYTFDFFILNFALHLYYFLKCYLLIEICAEFYSPIMHLIP
jgi:hypothetical protein